MARPTILRRIPRRVASAGASALALGVSVALFAAAAAGQHVSIAGEYGLSRGFISVFPQNQPTEVTCATSDARCLERAFAFNGGAPIPFASRAQTGVKGVPRVLQPISGVTTPLAIGDPFRIPSALMGQDRGFQRRVIVSGQLRNIETSQAYAMPAPARNAGPPPTTREFARRTFSTASTVAHGQNNGLAVTNPSYAFRQGLTTTISTTTASGMQNATVRYSGGLGFSGTMAALVRGHTARWRAVRPATAGSLIPPFVLREQTERGGPTSFAESHGAGFDYTVMRSRTAAVWGLQSSFFFGFVMPDGFCTSAPPPSPAGCNIVDEAALDVFGLQGTSPTAILTDHLFPWTTGTVSIMRQEVRFFGTFTYTHVARGYDTTTMTGMGATVRNVGLVAGSFTQRHIPGRDSSLEGSLIGADFRLVPEPGLGTLLLGGGAFLARLGRRRR